MVKPIKKICQKKINPDRIVAKLFKPFLANKCQVKIIYIPFKQSHQMFHLKTGQLEKYPQDKNTVHPKCSMEISPA